MRPYCLDCVIKHLGQAFVLQGEIEQGYPNHLLLLIGHLAEASEECIGASKELAEEIRQIRLSVLQNINKIYEGETIDIPYFSLFEKVLRLRKEKGCGDCKKAKEDFKEKIKKLRDS